MKAINFKPGLLHDVFSYMKVKVAAMNDAEKLCCLTLDECSITPSVEYDVNNGCILGDSTFPDASQKATHALVFMICGKSCFCLFSLQFML